MQKEKASDAEPVSALRGVLRVSPVTVNVRQHDKPAMFLTRHEGASLVGSVWLRSW